MQKIKDYKNIKTDFDINMSSFYDKTKNEILSGKVFNKCLTMVVLPAPDGAENMMAFPLII